MTPLHTTSLGSTHHCYRLERMVFIIGEARRHRFSSRHSTYSTIFHFNGSATKLATSRPNKKHFTTNLHKEQIMADNVPERYKPRYADDKDVDYRMQGFLTGFYRLSDDAKEDEAWVESFTEDADVVIGGDKGNGLEGELSSPLSDQSLSGFLGGVLSTNKDGESRDPRASGPDVGHGAGPEAHGAAGVYGAVLRDGDGDGGGRSAEEAGRRRGRAGGGARRRELPDQGRADGGSVVGGARGAEGGGWGVEVCAISGLDGE